MQTTWFRITSVIPAVWVILAILAIGSTKANGAQTYGTPMGTLSVTTPDTATETWPGDPKPHYLMQADQTYTAASYQYYVGKFDPHGSIGIRRFFQSRTVGTYSLTPASPLMTEINVLTKDMPANSPFNTAHANSSYGAYAPDQSTYTTTSLAANAVYGVETIELVFVEQQTGAQTVLDYQKIDIYAPQQIPYPSGNQPSNAASFEVQNFQSQVALNTDTTKAYLGDPPRVTMTTTQTIYPSATVYVVIYPGPAQTTPPANAHTISSSSWTAPSGDNAKYPTGVYMDVGNYITGSGIYTLQTMQQSSTNSFGTETFGAPASFSIHTTYNVTSQLGLEK